MADVQNLCLVCGHEMDDPPRDYNVCPSCGTEYGVNDVNASYDELRQAWLETGPVWWSKTDNQPDNWSPSRQLANLGPTIPAVTSTGLPLTQFACMAEDADYQEEARLLAQEFEHSDWQALGLEVADLEKEPVYAASW